MEPGSRAVITLGSGKDFYFDIAINLARSFEHWNRDNGARFYIVTDLDRAIPSDLKRAQIIRCEPGYLKRGFSAKIQMYDFAPVEEFLFIDADCLVLGDVTPIFEKMASAPVGIFGVEQFTGERFGDVEAIREALGIPFVPNFNGGVYYVRKGDLARNIFAYAEALEPRYDDVGFVRLRGQPNDEMLIGAALAHFGVRPIENDGRFYGDFQWWPRLTSMNVLKGVCEMDNPPAPHPLRQDSYPAAKARPLILHFLGHHIERAEYKEAARAFALAAEGALLPGLRSKIEAWPHYALRAAKKAGRPLFHAVFGVRPVRVERNRLLGPSSPP